MLLEMLPGPSKQTANTVQRCRGSRHRAQSSEPDLYTQARIALGGMIIITSPLPSHSTFPFLSAARKGKKSGELFSD